MTLLHGFTTGEGPASGETRVIGPAENFAMTVSARVVRCRAPSAPHARGHREHLGTSAGVAGYPAEASVVPSFGILRPR